jgi:hypothetical protein
MRGLIVLATALAALAAPVAAATGEPLTKRQVRAMSQPEFNRRAMGQVADLFDRRKPKYGKAPVNPLWSETFDTAPRSTSYKGLCRTDQLTVEFAPANGVGRGADQPRRASGFTARSSYGFVTEPPPGAGSSADIQVRGDEEFVPRTEPCTSLDLWEDPTFTADTEEIAVGGYLLFRKVLEEAPKADRAWSCQTRDAEGCVALLADLSPKSLWSVETCQAKDQSKVTSCYLYMAGERQIRVEYDPAASRLVNGGLQPVPLHIQSVEVATLIMMWHERVD